MREKTIDLLERILLNHALISTIHFREPLPALQKLNAEIEQHILELKEIPSAPSETSDQSNPTRKMSKHLQIISYINIPGKGLFSWADVNDSEDQLLQWGYWAIKRMFHRETGIWIYPVFRDGKITAVLNNKTETIGDYKIWEFTGK